MDILAELNPNQREAVETIEGPLLILAGPGSGKTRVVAHRISYLIKVCGMSPRRIMAVTFTNKAANEMKERLGHLLGHVASDLTLGTFHAIGARILRQEAKAAGLDSGFVIYDDGDRLSLIKRSIQEVGLDPKNYAPRALQSAISAAKNQLWTPQDYVSQGQGYFGEIVQRVYEHYEQLLTQSRALDFDDLLMKTVLLFKNHPSILSTYQSRYFHLLVDEFQDTNLAQYTLTRQIADKHRNICVVGDPDQSIYTWRFADLRNILNFEKDYPNAKLVVLEQSYRSTKTILDSATGIIAANSHRKPKNLWTENETGEPIITFEAFTEEEEAQFVVSEVEHLVSEGLAQLSDCAVMYRVNAQSRMLEETFIRYGVPYKLVAGTRFYERREVKDIIAYLKLIYNPFDSVSLTRIINIPTRGIGQRTLGELSQQAMDKSIPLFLALQSIAEAKEPQTISARTRQALTNFFNLVTGLIDQSHSLNLTELFDLVLDHSGYREYVLREEDHEERWENILELRTVVRDYAHLLPAEGLAAFLEGVALVSDVDGLNGKADVVTLITLHQAKGLEFGVVFIVGMEEGLLPHIRSTDDPEQMEEERRLCYVGVTRAEKRLYLVRAFRRSFLGGGSQNEPSRFLKSIPSHLLRARSWLEEKQPALFSSGYRPPNLSMGDRVRHTDYGEGIVIECLTTRNDQEITIAFARSKSRKFLLSLAPLEKLE